MGMTPRFVQVNGRSLYCAHFFNPQVQPRFRVLIAPPFAEELNKCRRLLALVARRLADQGCEVLFPDLFGTGDSAGDFSEARWRIWAEDWAALDEWFMRNSAAPRPAYLCVRSGVLLLAAARGRLHDFGRARIVLWQPVLECDRFLRAFLRLRTVSDRLAGRAESRRDLDDHLGSGHAVEIAGYELAAEMVAEMTELKLKASDLAGCAEIRVMEFRSNPNPVMSPTTSEFIDALQREHTEVIGAAIECEQFWATRDVVSPSAALSATMLALA